MFTILMTLLGVCAGALLSLNPGKMTCNLTGKAIKAAGKQLAMKEASAVGSAAGTAVANSAGKKIVSWSANTASGQAAQVGKKVASTAEKTLTANSKRGLNTLGKEGVLNGKQIWNPTKKRSPVENAYAHWKDHGHEFPGLQNAKQYVEHAHQLINNQNVLSRIRASDGALLRYDLKNNIFGSFTSKGIPKTMFKPQYGGMPSRYSTPLEYFYGQ